VLVLMQASPDIGYQGCWFNRIIIIEGDTHNHTSSDAGAILMRSIIDKTGIMDFLISGLHDRRDQNRITHSFAVAVYLDIIARLEIGGY